MSMIDELKGLGVDVNEGLDRVMGDTSLYEMMLGMFIGSVNDTSITPADFEESDLDPLIKKIHMLKGVTGNLAITPLFTTYTEVLGLLRNGQAKEARAGYEKLVPVQSAIVDCIKRYQAAN